MSSPQPQPALLLLSKTSNSPTHPKRTLTKPRANSTLLLHTLEKLTSESAHSLPTASSKRKFLTSSSQIRNAEAHDPSIEQFRSIPTESGLLPCSPKFLIHLLDMANLRSSVSSATKQAHQCPETNIIYRKTTSKPQKSTKTSR
ncbi:hypothetical protein KC19_8G160600 [Ceratodon purpureus]|uniref:Uncharacterized protein n=1 Tax=Ceratodon purpureus TaxID=3225 RepID=A0A8T0H1P7_CERPU|nr:hypothetical protein KC19_8G160600 [Ceratodon purpureus]